MPQDPLSELLSLPSQRLDKFGDPELSDLATSRRETPVVRNSNVFRLPYMTYEQVQAGADDMYDPTDFKTVGERLRTNVVKAIEKRFPVVGDKYTLTVENVHYEKQKNTTKVDERQILLNDSSLNDRLKGEWVLYDNTTGKEVQRKSATLLNVPRMTARGTFIRNGSELGLKHMFRLRPGIYTRIKNNGVVAAHINPQQTTGRQMSLDMDPNTGVFSVGRGTRTYGLLPILTAAGMDEDTIKGMWGEELFNINKSKYGRLMLKGSKSEEEYRNLWNNDIAPILLDAETTESTLGEPFAKMDPRALLLATKRILQVSSTMDESDTDDRDSLQYQKVMGPADYIPERIVRDGGGLLRNLFNAVTRSGNLDPIVTGAFQPQVDAVFLSDKHAGYIDGSSPVESYDFASSISRIGEGGIGDTRAAPAETRGVNNSYLGFIDPVRCYSRNHEIMTAEGWKNISAVTETDKVACMVNGAVEYHKPDSVHVYDYTEELYAYRSSGVAYEVTGNHRMWVVKNAKKGGPKKRGGYQKEYNPAFMFETASDMHNTNRRVITGGHLPYIGASDRQETIGEFDFRAYGVSPEDWGEFMGWYLSEGSTLIKNDKNQADRNSLVIISQDKYVHPDDYAAIETLLSRLPWPYKATKQGRSFCIYCRELAQYLRKFGYCHQKYIPYDMFDLPVSAREAFLRALLRGDGRKPARNEGWVYTTTSIRLASDVERLMFDLGYATTIHTYKDSRDDKYLPVYEIRALKSTRGWLIKNGRAVTGRTSRSDYYKKIPCDGQVFCVTVPGGLVYTRIPGHRGFWCGNSPECYAEGTELLTREGWKDVSKCGKDDLFACLVDGRLEYHKASAYNVHEYSGVMYGYKSDFINYLVTPNHRMYVKDNVFSEPAIQQAKDVHGTSKLVLLYTSPEDTEFGELCTPGYYTEEYSGKVYCPTVPGGLVYCRRGKESHGFWCGNSLKVGLDVFLSYGVKKDSNGNLYNKFINRAGKPEWVRMDRVAKSIVATPEFFNPKANPEEFIPAIVRGKTLDYVQRKDVDYYVADSNRMMSMGAGMIPLIGGIRSNRTLMGCLHPDTLLKVIRGGEELQITAGDYLKSWQLADEMVSTDNSYMSVVVRPVRGVYKVTTDLAVFNVVLEHGHSAVVNGSHKWAVARRSGFSLVTTAELAVGDYIPVVREEYLDYPRTTKFTKVVVDKVVAIEPCGEAPYLVDIDVDDNLYMLANGMFTHNSKYANQGVPLEHGEAPLVQRALTLDDGTETTSEAHLGEQLGARRSPVSGQIIQIDGDEIIVRDKDGVKHSVDLYRELPANQKGFLNNTPIVNIGDKVNAGQVIARSNYTNDEGVAALGKNLKVAFMTARGGGTFEDGITISESAAQKLKSEQLYKVRGDLTDDIEYSKEKFLNSFKQEYTDEQLAKIGDDGLPRPGAVFNEGDPVFLGIQIRDIGVHGLSRNSAVPYVHTWEHEAPGTVLDVVRGKKHLSIYAKAYTPMQIGDKMCFDDKTEVLTDRGWSLFKDLTGDERVLTLDVKSGDTFMSEYTRRYQYYHKGRMYSAKSDKLDILVTDNHQMLMSCLPTSAYIRMQTPVQVFGKALYFITGHDIFKPESYTYTKDPDFKESWELYEGFVYCITVPQTHIMYVRRNGKCCWSGNSNRYGAKGVVAQILPDDQMPVGADGTPFEVLQSPLGLPSRLNTSQLCEAQLGKIAKATGTTYALPDFLPENDDIIDFTDRELKKAGLSAAEDVYDPVSGKTVPGIETGNMFFYKLKHMSELKERGRATGLYSAEDIPMKGEGAARRFGSMEASAVYSGGGEEVLRDAKVIRGQRNDEFWRDFRNGKYPETPSIPLVHKKFFAHLQAAGVNLEDRADRVHIYGATNDDMKRLTGPRKVTAAATFDSKNLQPIDGGLFDPKIFGADGDQWGYVDLPEPVLNPIMFKTIGSVLGWKDKELQEYLTGERQVDGKFGSNALKEMLDNVDLNSELKKAKNLLKSTHTTLQQRDLARKRIRAIEPMIREGKKPSDFFWDRIPILPPRFRAVTAMANGTNIAADANFLYKRLMDSIDDLNDAKKMLPEDMQLDARQSVYNAVSAVAGLTPTDDPKLEAKGVSGVLKWAFGKGSPKLGATHRKVFGANLDLGGLGTITPDDSLTIDQVGIPERSAWKMFEPFVVRRLTQQGYSLVDATRAVVNRNDDAERALKAEMSKRPILVNRAPTLWRYGIQGMYPVMVKDNTIHVNPNICKVYNADMDGDSIRGSIQIVLSSEFFKEELDKSQNSDILSNINQNKEDNMLHKDAKVSMVNVRCSICDVPKIEESAKQISDTVIEWDVPAGVFTEAVDKATGKKVVAPVTKLSLHKNVDMYDIHLATYGAYKHIITVSKDDTLLTYDKGDIVITDARTAKGKLVPRAKATDAGMSTEYCTKYIDLGTQVPLTFDTGVFLGMLIGDGWVDTRESVWLSAEDANIQKWAIEFMNDENCYVSSNHNAHVYEYATERFGSDKAHRVWMSIPRSSARAIKEAIGSGAYNKRIPFESLAASKAHRLGILVGLISTDGNVSYSDTPAKGKKSSQKSIIFHTTSQDLRDNIIDLCFSLGVRATATEYRGVNSKAPCYGVNLSVRDMSKLYREDDRFRLIAERDEENMRHIAAAVEREAEDSFDAYDIVPYPKHLSVVITAAAGDIIISTERNRYKNKGYLSRDLAKLVVERMKSFDFSEYTEVNSGPVDSRPGLTPAQAAEGAKAWISIVEDESVCWEVVTDVKHLGLMDGWDVTVPGPLTFMLGCGTFVQDSMTTHVPVSNEAVEAIKKNMLPSKNLLSPRDFTAHFIPRAEFAQGLYLASRVDANQRPVRFRTEEEAVAAYKRGDIKVDTPVEIG